MDSLQALNFYRFHSRGIWFKMMNNEQGVQVTR